MRKITGGSNDWSGRNWASRASILPDVPWPATKSFYILSIVGVALTPPVLVASIYGMNFHHMPELDWPLGYLWGLGLMLVSAVGPFLFFKLRGWL